MDVNKRKKIHKRSVQHNSCFSLLMADKIFFNKWMPETSLEFIPMVPMILSSICFDLHSNFYIRSFNTFFLDMLICMFQKFIIEDFSFFLHLFFSCLVTFSKLFCFLFCIFHSHQQCQHTVERRGRTQPKPQHVAAEPAAAPFRGHTAFAPAAFSCHVVLLPRWARCAGLKFRKDSNQGLVAFPRVAGPPLTA